MNFGNRSQEVQQQKVMNASDKEVKGLCCVGLHVKELSQLQLSGEFQVHPLIYLCREERTVYFS
jgi:hypothetical protein